MTRRERRGPTRFVCRASLDRAGRTGKALRLGCPTARTPPPCPPPSSLPPPPCRLLLPRPPLSPSARARAVWTPPATWRERPPPRRGPRAGALTCATAPTRSASRRRRGAWGPRASSWRWVGRSGKRGLRSCAAGLQGRRARHGLGWSRRGCLPCHLASIVCRDDMCAALPCPRPPLPTPARACCHTAWRSTTRRWRTGRAKPLRRCSWRGTCRWGEGGRQMGTAPCRAAPSLPSEPFPSLSPALATTAHHLLTPPTPGPGAVQHLHAGAGRQPARPPGGAEGHAAVGGGAEGRRSGCVGMCVEACGGAHAVLPYAPARAATAAPRAAAAARRAVVATRSTTAACACRRGSRRGRRGRGGPRRGGQGRSGAKEQVARSCRHSLHPTGPPASSADGGPRGPPAVRHRGRGGDHDQPRGDQAGSCARLCRCCCLWRPPDPPCQPPAPSPFLLPPQNHSRYSQLLGGSEAVESSLAGCFAEHLNAEARRARAHTHAPTRLPHPLYPTHAPTPPIPPPLSRPRWCCPRCATRPAPRPGCDPPSCTCG
jgi:hypothetical protein